jgi:anthranilate phosphoribosyltransferase
LLNPAQAPYVVMGVFEQAMVLPQAQVLQRLGVQRAWVIHSQDGMDELSISAPTWVTELAEGNLHSFVLDPQAQELGIARAPRSVLEVSSPQASEALIRAVLDPTQNPGPARDIVSLNAAAALLVSGVYPSLPMALAAARQALTSGKAQQKLTDFIALTQRLACLV